MTLQINWSPSSKDFLRIEFMLELSEISTDLPSVLNEGRAEVDHSA